MIEAMSTSLTVEKKPVNVSEPLVSVVILTYNSSQYLLQTLNSIAAQQYRNIELIVTDDCSSDNTVKLANQWMAKNKGRFTDTKVLTTQFNTGVSGNCNRGVAASTGEFVKLFGGDDILLPHYLTDMVAGIGDNDLAFCYLYLFMEESDLEKPYSELDFIPKTRDFYELDSEQLYKKQLVQNDFNAPAALIRKSVFEQVGGYDEDYPLMEDLPFWLKCVEAGKKFVFIETFGVLYRQSISSISRGMSLFKIKKESLEEKKFQENFDRFAFKVRYPEMLRLHVPIMVSSLRFDTTLKTAANGFEKTRCQLTAWFSNQYEQIQYERGKLERKCQHKKYQIHKQLKDKEFEEAHAAQNRKTVKEKKGISFWVWYRDTASTYKMKSRQSRYNRERQKIIEHQFKSEEKLNWNIYKIFSRQYLELTLPNLADAQISKACEEKKVKNYCRLIKRRLSPFLCAFFGAQLPPQAETHNETKAYKLKQFFSAREMGAPFHQLVGILFPVPQLMWRLLIRPLFPAVRSWLYSGPSTFGKRALLRLLSWARHPRTLLGSIKYAVTKPYTVAKRHYYFLLNSASAVAFNKAGIRQPMAMGLLGRFNGFKSPIPYENEPLAKKHPFRRFLQALRQEQGYKKHVPAKKLMIVMVVNLNFCLSSCESIYLALRERDDIDVIFLLTPTRQPGTDKTWYYDDGLIETMRAKGYNFQLGLENGRWHSILDFEPDAVFFQTPYHWQRPSLYSPLYTLAFPKVMYTPYGPWIMDMSVTDYLESGIDRQFFNVMWRFFADKLSAERLEAAAPEYAPLMVHSGSPKMDFHKLPLAGEGYCWKLSGQEPNRKRVIWLPRWGVEERRTLFMDLYEYVLELIAQTPQMDFVMRPHPFLFKDLIRSKFFDEASLKELATAFETPVNSCIDYKNDYREGLLSCDFIIADFTSVLYEYLPTGKPIIYTKVDNTLIDSRIMEACYVVEDLAGFQSAVTQLLNGIDPLKVKREALVNELDFFPSGATSNGHYIAEYIADNLREEWSVSTC